MMRVSARALCLLTCIVADLARLPELIAPAIIFYNGLMQRPVITLHIFPYERD